MNDFNFNIYKIFSNEPQEDNSIKVDFDGIQTQKDLFECMLMFLTNGLKVKYGNQNGIVFLNNLEKKNFIEIKQYFRSFGINFFYEKIFISNKSDFNKHMIDFSKYKSNTNFNEFIFTLYSKPYIYKFSFDFL